MNEKQRQAIKQNLEALQAWTTDFNSQRAGGTYPMGVEVDVRDSFQALSRLMSSVIHLLIVLSEEEND